MERKIGYPKLCFAKFFFGTRCRKRRYAYKLIRKENNIALLGDIGNPFHQNYRDFLSYTSDRWENVFLLAGNHEYWKEKYNYYDVNDKIEEVCSLFDNVTFLNNKRASFSFGSSLEYLILGTTLWSHILPNKSSWNVMGDDLRINLVDKSFNALHEESKNWLIHELSILSVSLTRVSEEHAKEEHAKEEHAKEEQQKEQQKEKKKREKEKRNYSLVSPSSFL